MAREARRLTADDAYRLQSAEPGRHGYELVHGELVPLTPASLPHGRVSVRIARLLDEFTEDRRSGRVYSEGGFVFHLPDDPERVRAPDVAFVSTATLAKAGGEPEKGFAPFPPDLAVEVFSPSNLKDALQFQQRLHDYLRGGVRLVWVVYPESRSAMALRSDGSARLLTENESLDGEDVLPGFHLPLSRLFL